MDIVHTRSASQAYHHVAGQCMVRWRMSSYVCGKAPPTRVQCIMGYRYGRRVQHSDTHTLTCTHTHSHAHTHTTSIHSLSHTHLHTHTLTFSLFLSLSLTHTCMHAHTHSHWLTHAHTQSMNYHHVLSIGGSANVTALLQESKCIQKYFQHDTDFFTQIFDPHTLYLSYLHHI